MGVLGVSFWVGVCRSQKGNSGHTDNIPKAQCAPGGLSLLHGTVLADKVKGNGSCKLGCQHSQRRTEVYVQNKGTEKQGVRLCQPAAAPHIGGLHLSGAHDLAKMASGQ